MQYLQSFDELAPGLVVSRLTYHCFDFSLPLTDPPTFDEAHEVAVVFEGDLVARFTWQLAPPRYERLVVGTHALNSDAELEARERSDGGPYAVDATARWGLGGAVLQGHHVVLGETGFGLREEWSCRLDFDHDRSLVVALGELSSDTLVSYIPDSLVVTGNAEVARSYRPIASDASAFGA